MCAASPIIIFFFNDTATTEIYTFPYTTLFRSRCVIGGIKPQATDHGSADVRSDDHSPRRSDGNIGAELLAKVVINCVGNGADRKSTRLNSSHSQISYAPFCLRNTIQTSPQAST